MVTRAEKKTLHKHGCRRCHHVYEDTCFTPTEDDLCVTCRGGKPMALMVEGRLPRPCCVGGGSRLATKDAKKAYALAGSTNWWQCTTCKRVFPRDVRAEQPFIWQDHINQGADHDPPR